MAGVQGGRLGRLTGTAVRSGARELLEGKTLPSAAVASLANQGATFGALTLAGAGGFKPVDASGNTVALTSYNSLVSGVLGSYTPSILNGGLRFTGAAGAPNGVVLRCGYAGGTVDITVTTAANTYSVSTAAELDSAVSSMGSAGGKTISLRRGVYSGTLFWANNLNFTAAPTFVGEGLPFVQKGAQVNGSLVIANQQNAIWTNLEIWTPTGGSSVLQMTGGCANIVVDTCYIHGKYHDPMVDQTVGYANGIAGIEFNDIPGLTIRKCLIEHVDNGILFNITGDCLIEDNEIRFFRSDGIHLGLNAAAKTSNKIFRRNVIYGTMYLDGAHSDGIQIVATGTLDADQYTNLTLEQNVIFNSTAISIGLMQGIVSFTDGTTFGVNFVNPTVRGNIILGMHLHGISFNNMDGGSFVNNVIVHTDTTIDTVNTTALNIGGGGRAIGTITVDKNVFEGASLMGTATYATPTGNVTIGAAGVTIPLSTVFNDPTPATPKTGYADVLVKRTAKAGGPAATIGAGALGVGFGTYGSPRTPAGWSIP